MIEYRSAKILILSFLSFILAGTFLLSLPMSTHPDSISLVNALFTATSAVCVTGLTVVNTGTYFTRFGQTVILVLIQLGGLGIMTFSTFFAVTLGRRLSFGERFIFKETLGERGMLDIFRVLRHIFVFTVIMEAVGLAFLYRRMSDIYAPLKAFYYSLFHSVSAFCNAGFSLYTDSLIRFRGDWLINIVVPVLIVVGGLGFLVIEDIYQFVKAKLKYKRNARLHLHSKIVISTTVFLIIAGAVIFYLLEAANALEGSSLKDSVFCSFFQSITARTAGFNTLDIFTLSNASLFMLSVLMFIGGSPGSTAGGIKTTTFAILVFLFLSRLRGKERVSVFKRKIPFDILAKALSIFFASFILIVVVTMLLQVTEHWGHPHDVTRGDFLELLFETVSAFGTVGLSSGMTSGLSWMGKILITITMFVGRLGPLTMAIVVVGGKRKEERFELPEENVMIG